MTDKRRNGGCITEDHQPILGTFFLYYIYIFFIPVIALTRMFLWKKKKKKTSLFPFIRCKAFQPLMLLFFFFFLQLSPLLWLSVTSVEFIHDGIFRKVSLSRTALLLYLRWCTSEEWKIRLRAAPRWWGSESELRDSFLCLIGHFWCLQSLRRVRICTEHSINCALQPVNWLHCRQKAGEILISGVVHLLTHI